MATTNIIAIASVAAAANINLVLQAIGMGPDALRLRLTSDQNATWEDDATHLCFSYQNAPVDLQAVLLAATDGDLPPLPPETVWGEDGVIGAAEAMAAMSQLRMASFSDGFVPMAQLQACMASHDPVLYLVPDPEE